MNDSFDWIPATIAALSSVALLILTILERANQWMKRRDTRRNKQADERARQEMERDPEARFEVINIRFITESIVVILVRNKSAITTNLHKPEFELRGSPGSCLTDDRIQVSPFDTASFRVRMDRAFNINKKLLPKDCSLLSIGTDDQA